MVKFKKLRQLAERLSSRPSTSSNRSMFSDPAPRVTGEVTIRMQPAEADPNDPDAWEVVTQESNLVVTQAEALMAQMSINAPNSAFSYIELGNPAFPATPPALDDATLQSSTGTRKAVTSTASGNVVTNVVTFDTTEGNGFTFTEAGLFVGLLGSGTMFARKTFASIPKTASFRLSITWAITFLVADTGGGCTGVSLLNPSTVSAFTFATASGGESSIAATFDFAVGANNIDVFLDRQRLVPGVHYIETATLAAPVLGSPVNKGINLVGFTLNPNDEVFLIQRSLTP